MKRITKYAKAMRRHPTLAEKELKKNLLRWMIKFRTQRMFDFYIVDFLIPDRWLIIEVDGDYHKTQKDYDKRRDAYLKTKGHTVLRFTNEEVMTNTERIREAILAHPVKPLPLNPRDLYGRSAY